MDHLLLPSHPTSDRVKVPYVCKERYDGLPFWYYPKRKGLPALAQGPSEFAQHEAMHPTPATEQEPFFQTWLCFGLLSELMGGNNQGKYEDPVLVQEDAGQADVLTRIYEKLVYIDNGSVYITTANLVPLMDDLMPLASTSTTDTDVAKENCRHFSRCIDWAYQILHTCGPDFDHRVRYSIAAIGETVSLRVNAVCRDLRIREDCPTQWSEGYYNADVKQQMEINGWCPSDISRCEEIFHSMQTLHLISKLNKAQPGRDHSECPDDTCNLYQIDTSKAYVVAHADDTCNCDVLEVDSAAVVRVLEHKEHGIVPILRIDGERGDLSDLAVTVLESINERPYMALSHVSVRVS
jgi:hypothetical protein